MNRANRVNSVDRANKADRMDRVNIADRLDSVDRVNSMQYHPNIQKDHSRGAAGTGKIAPLRSF